MLGVSVHGTTPSKRYRARTSTGTGGPPFRVHVSPYSFSRPKMRRLIALGISKARALFCRTPCRRGEEQTAQRAVQRAFDAARARAAILAQTGGPGEPAAAAPRATARADRRAELRAAIEQDERDVARLRAQARAAAAAARPALDRELAAATNRLDLRRLQLDFATKLSELDAGTPDDTADLPDQI